VPRGPGKVCSVLVFNDGTQVSAASTGALDICTVFLMDQVEPFHDRGSGTDFG
jgi:hypothetical protein